MQNSNQISMKSSKTSFLHPMAWLLIVILALIAGWTALWFFAASKVEDKVNAYMDKSADRGVEIICDNKAVKGYPFRIGLFCDDVAVIRPDKEFLFSAGGLRTAAQIYKPNHMIVELDAPARIKRQGLAELEINWSLLHASLQYGLTGLYELAAEFNDMQSQLIFSETDKKPDAAIEQGQIFMRSQQNDKKDNLETAINLKKVKFLDAVLTNLPLLNIFGQGTYHDLGKLFEKGQLQHFDIKQSGLTGNMQYLRFEIADATAGSEGNNGQFQIAGPWEVTKNGKLTADITLTVSNINVLLATVQKSAPDLLPIATGLAQGLATFGKSVNLNGKDAKQLSLSIKRNEVRIGFFKIGKIPRLF
jgi:hypothetical protein